ncbi:MAG TPA: alpha/beta hydrolase [Candidatus Hydrogenedentes bacterium]|nr:alpha/beta hydrolase [Candidatus Hydrogenedentota bacterium]
MKKFVLIFAASIALVVVLAGGLAYYIFLARASGEFFDSDGVRIFYTDQGAGEPVILIHGFAVQGDFNWRRPGVIDRLARRFRVIVPDLRGHGRSDKPHDPEQYGREMVEDVVRLMDHLGIEKAHVAGYSLGGFLTLKLAAMHPDRLITASPLGAGWERPEESAFLSRAPDLARMLEEGRGIKPPSGDFGADRERTGLIHTWTIKLVTRYLNDGKALAAMLRAAQDLVVSADEIRGIVLPMLSIVGSRDPLKVGVDNLREHIRGIEVVVIDGATHMNAMMRDQFIEALEGFLARGGTAPIDVDT